MASKSLTLMIEFLADVKKVLEESPEGNVFDLSFWKCGTTCCAIGWAASTQWFQEKWDIELMNLQGHDWVPVNVTFDTKGWIALLSSIYADYASVERTFLEDIFYTCFSPDYYYSWEEEDLEPISIDSVKNRIDTCIKALTLMVEDESLYDLMVSYTIPESSSVDFIEIENLYKKPLTVGEYILEPSVWKDGLFTKPPIKQTVEK